MIKNKGLRSGRIKREDIAMKNEKISRRSFLKASAVASALGVMAAAPAAHAAGADEAAAQIEEENCLLKKPKYIFLFIGDGMGTAQIQSARFYKGTVDNNGAVTEADLSFTSFPTVGSVTTYDKVLRGFERIHLQPGEEQTISFTLTPQDLGLWDKNNQFTVEPGSFSIMIGASSQDIRLKGSFEVQ